MLRWLEGFELEQVTGYFDRSYATRTGTISGTLAGREQGSSLEASGSGDLELTTPILVAVAENTWTVGFGVRFSSTTNTPIGTGITTFPGIGIRKAGTEQLAVEFIPDNRDAGGWARIQVSRGGTILGTTTLGIPSLQWHYVEFTVVVRTGVNGSIEIKVGKGNAATVQWLNLTGVNTANAATDGADNFRLKWSNSGVSSAFALDDIYINDSTGALNNTYLGPISVVGLIPNATGATMAWALDGAAASVQDAWDDAANSQTGADDDKRVTAETIGQIALAGYPDPTYLGSTNTIKGLMLRTSLGMDSTGTRTVRHRLRDTALVLETDGSKDLVTASTTYATGYEIFETNPNGGAAWNQAAINALQSGVNLTA